MTKSKNKAVSAEVKTLTSKKPLKIINRSEIANVSEDTTEQQTKSINQLIVNDNKDVTDAKSYKIAKPATKQSILINLLQSSAGATVGELAVATGWQKHSVHGVMSGVLKKKLGLAITSSKEERGLVYRIVSGA